METIRWAKANRKIIKKILAAVFILLFLCSNAPEILSNLYDFCQALFEFEKHKQPIGYYETDGDKIAVYVDIFVEKKNKNAIKLVRLKELAPIIQKIYDDFPTYMAKYDPGFTWKKKNQKISVNLVLKENFENLEKVMGPCAGLAINYPIMSKRIYIESESYFDVVVNQETIRHEFFHCLIWGRSNIEWPKMLMGVCDKKGKKTSYDEKGARLFENFNPP